MLFCTSIIHVPLQQVWYHGSYRGLTNIRFMNYEQTIRLLYSMLPAYHRIGKAAYRNDLGITIALDEYFDHPHRRYRIIHIAGTNGKGSVSHMVASVLQEAGYKTGLYTSPHLKDFRERIRVNGRMIPKLKVIRFTEKHSEIITGLKPSFFELTAAMAFDHFARENVDIAVIETGMGGRLDSTNIVSPVLSVITNIGHDHMDLLGDTLEKVAMEKAGIIKTGVPVVISETQSSIKDVFTGVSRERHSPLIFADQHFKAVFSGNDPSTGLRNFSVSRIGSGEVLHGSTPLGGDYQPVNIQAVFAVFDALREAVSLNSQVILDGIEKVITNTGLAGRWHILSRKPLTICDTGHNREGLQYVVSQLEKLPKRNLHMVLGFVSDKDLGLVLPLLPEGASYYFTKASIQRALGENELMKKASEYGLKGSAWPDVASALEAARSAAGESDVIFIGGSTFVVAEVI